MKNQTVFAFVAGVAVAGLVLPSAAVAVDVPAVSGESVPFGVGESRKTLRLRDGKEVPQVGLRVSENKLEVTQDDGCKWTRPVDDIYGPSLTWENCSPGKWGSGWIEDVFKRGQLWPLAVGNKVKYEYRAVSSAGNKNNRAFRECEVTGTEMVKAGGKDYATYRVECTEHSGTRVFNYAPEVRTTVYMDRNHKKRGRATMEYLKDL
jgi:hypothetical protein